MVYSIATALCAVAPDLGWLLVFRFFVGVGLGAQLPVAVTLVSEYVPAKVRGRFIVLLEKLLGLGWLAAALVSYLSFRNMAGTARFNRRLADFLCVFYLEIYSRIGALSD